MRWPFLYEEDSGISSGTLEDITVSEGVTRRDAVRTLLKKLVTYQNQNGPGRESILLLQKALPENQGHLLPYLDSASIEDLKGCKCQKINGKVKVQGHLKFKSSRTRQDDDALDISDLLPETEQTPDRNNKRPADNEADNAMLYKKVKSQGHSAQDHPQIQTGDGSYADGVKFQRDYESGSSSHGVCEPVTINMGQDHLGVWDSDKGQGHQIVRYVTPPGRVKIGPDRQHRSIMAACGEMDELINEGLWDQFHEYTQRLLLGSPDDVDARLNVLHHVVFSHCVQNSVSSQTHDLLKQSRELVPQSSCPQYFEIDYIGLLSKVFRKEKQYGVVQCCMDVYQKSQLLLPEKIVTIQRHRNAEYLIHQFQHKFCTGAVPENILREIEDGFLSCIEQSARVREFFRASNITVKYADDCYVSGRRCHIHLALFYLRCCVTGRGSTQALPPGAQDLTRAEHSLARVREEWGRHLHPHRGEVPPRHVRSAHAQG